MKPPRNNKTIMSDAEYMLLVFVHDNTGEIQIRMKELCELFHMSRQGLEPKIKRLQEKGLLELEDKQTLSKASANKRVLILTDKAKDLLKKH